MNIEIYDLNKINIFGENQNRHGGFGTEIYKTKYRILHNILVNSYKWSDEKKNVKLFVEYKISKWGRYI